MDRLRSVSMETKVLMANTLVIIIGAIAGTLLSVWVTEHHGADSGRWLMLPFATSGVLVGMAINHRLLRAAFSPIRELERVAQAVRAGDYSARVQPGRFPDPQLDAFAQSFNQTLSVVEEDRSRIRQLANRITSIQEEERKRVARDLHDDTAQVLFGQLLRVTGMRANAPASAQDSLASMEDALQASIESVRQMATELRPPALDDLGLREALDGLCQRSSDRMGVPVIFTAQGKSGRVPGDARLVLYRLAQEALTNAFKHARATEITVHLDVGTDQVTLAIRDNGRGFDVRDVRTDTSRGLGLGLFGMRERVDLVDGTLVIDGNQNPGTLIQARIPMDGAVRAPRANH